MTSQRLAVLGMLAAIAFLLMATISIPIVPSAPYLRYDPSDATALLAGVLYGPGPGVAVVAVKDLLYFAFRARGPFGPAADFIAAATFVAVTAWAYRRRQGSFTERLMWAAAVGTAARVLVTIPANFVILDLQFGMPPERVAAMLLPVLVPFNAVKALLNAAIALVLAEPFVRRVRPGPGTRPAGGQSR